MFDDSIIRVRRFFVQNRENLKHWMASAIDAGKLSVLIAGPVGLYILVAYLQSVRAPLPISDFSTIQTLLIIAATYILVVGFIFAVVYFPVFTCLVPRKWRIHIRVKIPSYNFCKRDWIEQLGNQPFLFHGSSTLLIPTYSVLWISRASDVTSYLWLSFALIVGAISSVIIFYTEAIISNRTQKFRTKLAFRVFTGSLMRGGWCIAWLHIIARLNLAFPIIRDFQASSPGRIATWTFFLCITFFMYFGLTSIKVRPERILIVILFGLMGALAYYPSFFSQRTLHLLGIGGGIPVKVLVKTMDPEGTNVIARSINGCLILNTGSRIILQILETPTVNICSQLSSQNEARYAAMYKEITVLSGSDVIRISGYPFASK